MKTAALFVCLVVLVSCSLAACGGSNTAASERPTAMTRRPPATKPAHKSASATPVTLIPTAAPAPTQPINAPAPTAAVAGNTSFASWHQNLLETVQGIDVASGYVKEAQSAVNGSNWSAALSDAKLGQDQMTSIDSLWNSGPLPPQGYDGVNQDVANAVLEYDKSVNRLVGALGSSPPDSGGIAAAARFFLQGESEIAAAGPSVQPQGVSGGITTAIPTVAPPTTNNSRTGTAATPTVNPSASTNNSGNSIGLLDKSGTGAWTSPTFDPTSDWQISYRYDCSREGSPGNFIVNVFAPGNSPTVDGVNELKMRGSGTTHVHDVTGSGTYLSVNSECDWHVAATGPGQGIGSDSGGGQSDSGIVLVDQRGSGQWTSPKFDAPGDWQIAYSYDCTSQGGPGNFIIDVSGPGNSPTADGANEMKTSGSGTTYIHDASGHGVYFDVNSECDWHVTASG